MTASDTALVFASDERYARALSVALYSTLRHLSRTANPDLYVLDQGMTASSRARLQRVIANSPRKVCTYWLAIGNESLPRTLHGSYLSSAAYSRLLIPRLLGHHVRRAVYLDADILVRGDLSPLFSIDLHGTPLAATRDLGIPTTDHDRSGIPPPVKPRPYFNTGVLVLDVDRWRAQGLADRALEYAAMSDPPLLWADQDALNAVIDTWQELDQKWNLQEVSVDLSKRRLLIDRGYRRRRSYLTARVLHFVGPPKPWDNRCETPGTLIWLCTLARSGWYERSEGAHWLARHLFARARRRAAAR